MVKCKKSWLVTIVIAVLMLCLYYVNIKERNDTKNLILRWREKIRVPISDSVLTVNRQRIFPTPRPGECGNVLPHLANFEKFTKSGIPLIIHQVYADVNVPEQYITFMKGCKRLNKEFVHILWTDADFDAFLKTKRPDLKELYRNFSAPDQKSDFMRLVVLDYFGGVYFDLDVECRKPLKPFLDSLEASCVIDRERELQTRLLWDRNFSAMNSIMMSKAEHKFIRYLITMLPTAMHHKNVLLRTGPFYMTERYREFMNRTDLADSDKPYLASPFLFSPLLDTRVFPIFNKKCEKNETQMIPIHRIACKEWKQQKQTQDVAKTVANSVLVHHFMHLANDFRNRIKRRINACKEIVDVKRYILPSPKKAPTEKKVL